jgi:predicted permease
VREFVSRLVDWFRRERLDAELQEELRFHQTQLERDARATGVTGEDARSQARSRLGNATRLTEAARERWSVPWLDHLQQDVRYAARGLHRSPGFAAAAVLTLALGIGANATMFGIVDRLLLRPPAHVVAPERVMTPVYLRTSDGQTGTQEVLSFPLFTDLRESGAFEQVAAYSPLSLATGRGADAQLLRAMRVSASFFATLGTRPVAGRFFRPDEDGDPIAPNVAVISHAFWQRALQGSAAAMGRSLELSGVPYEIVGVAPPGFTGLSSRPIDVWIPLTAGIDPAERAEWDVGRNTFWLRVVGRLGDSVSRAQAAALATAGIRAGAERAGAWTPRYAALNPGIGLVSVLPREANAQDASSRVALLLGVVSLLVLLIACANVANLQLARGVARRREVAVRIALGVRRGRLLAQFLTESFLLSLAGGLAALVVRRLGTVLVQGVLFPNAAWADEPAVDPQLLVYMFGAAVTAGLASGLVPAIQSTSPQLTSTLKEGARSGRAHQSRTRLVLLLTQTSLSVVLLIAAGLFARSLSRIQSVPLGFEPDRVLFASIVTDGLALDPATQHALYDRLHEAARRLPDVEGAALATSVPFHSSWATSVSIPGRDSLPAPRDGGNYFIAATSELFVVMGIRLLRGRGITDQDNASSPPVVVINETMARLWWPGEDAIGKCMRIDADTMPCAEVVGIAANMRRQEIIEDDMLQFFLPIGQSPEWLRVRMLVIRPRDNAAAVASRIRRQLQTAAPGLPYLSVRPLQQLVSPQAHSWRLGATVFSAFGVLALLVAAVGLYSLLAFDVAQRAHELGIRRALGASTASVTRLVLGQSLRLTTLGGAAGLAIALAAAPWIQRFLFRTSARDATTLGLAVAVLVVVGCVAALVPTWRAARVDPVTTLRAE